MPAAALCLISGEAAREVTCGESCDDYYGREWYNDPEAWQWTAQLGLVAIGAALFVGSAILMMRRHTLWALALIPPAIVPYVYWFNEIAPHASTS